MMGCSGQLLIILFEINSSVSSKTIEILKIVQEILKMKALEVQETKVQDQIEKLVNF